MTDIIKLIFINVLSRMHEASFIRSIKEPQKKSRNKINAAGSSEFRKDVCNEEGYRSPGVRQDTFKELKYLMRKKGLRSCRLKAKHCLLKPGIQ